MVNLSCGIVALGANLPASTQSPWQTLRQTVGILHSEPDISIFALSRFWRTPAVPAGTGPDFANAVALIRSTLAPEALLARLHAIEAEAGRDRSTGRWSARVLDLDLIAMDEVVLPDAATLRHWIDLPVQDQRRDTPDRLLLPHPRMQDRAFVLAPLAEIAPGWRHPLTGHSAAQMLAALGPDALAGMQPMPMHEIRAFA
ncbi:MAG: 2-amino-4-hydroxy-6-hydroxymethyldihydropteridine diphosphokinase [Paracoccus sp. (in: a-proteobacteria)]